jgi:predicted acyltransferase
LYRFTHVPNFDQPFTDQHNFGNYIDLKIMNYINPDGWVAINCIPTAVHTIAGAMVGKMLLSKGVKKLQPMLLAAVICLVAGYALDWANITPIIKRIATSSFTLVSLGWVLLMLAVCYWWIDIKDHRKHLTFFLIIGTNSLFIYLFFEIVGHRWFTGYITFIVTQIFGFVHAPEMLGLIVAALTVFGLEWALCYWLYRKKIFFKL